MDCALFEDVVHDIERPGTAGFTLREKALAHAESCADCARLMTQIESLDAGLRALAASSRRQAPAGVEAQLMAEFRRQKMARARSGVRRQIAALSTAAAALLAVGFTLHHFAVHQTNPAPPVAHSFSAPASPASANAQNSANWIDTDDSEYASFVPLPYADDPSALDDGTVVRVEMPRAALASFGLPVAAMESDGRVRADLIVSADGTPQAIRLVPQGSTARE
jgi:anti-sigma factor RsiW